MRTSLFQDDDDVAKSRGVTQSRRMSLEVAVPEVARQSEPGGHVDFPVFCVTPGARTITLDDVKSLEDDD